MDAVDLGELGDHLDVVIHMVHKALDVHRYFAGQQQLLLVELFRHLVLERLMEELSKNNDKRENNEQGKDENRRREQLSLF